MAGPALLSTSTELDTKDGRPKVRPTVMGIDTQQLIDVATVEVEHRIEVNEGAIDKTDAKLKAYSTVEQKVNELNSSLNSLRGLDPLRYTSTNTFDLRKGVSQSNMGLEGSDYAVIMADNGSPERVIPIVVNQVATSDIIQASVSGSANAADDMLALPALATLTINGYDITTDATWSLNDLADEINNEIGADAMVVASVVGSGTSYRLQLVPSDAATSTKITVEDDQGGAVIDAMHLARNKYVAHGGDTDGNLIVNGTNIAITEEMSLVEVAKTINAYKDDTRVVAVVDQLTIGDYRLSLKHVDTGELITVDDDAGGQIYGGLNLAVNSGKTEQELEAQFQLDGQPAVLTRKTNDIKDAIEGATIKLIQATEDGQSLKLVIDPDLDQVLLSVSTAIGAIEQLVQVYVDSETASVEDDDTGMAVLKGDSFLRDMYVKMTSILSGEVSGIATSGTKSLADIGVTLIRDDTGNGTFLRLQTDLEKLKEAIQTDPELVERLLSFKATSSSPYFRMMDSPRQLAKDIAGKDITVSVWKDAAEAVQATFTVDGQAYGATIDSNGLITGMDSTIFEGFSINLSPTTLQDIKDAPSDPMNPTTSVLKITKGLFDSLGDVITEAARKSTDFGTYGYMSGGGVQRAEGELEAEKQRLQEDNVRLEERKERKRAAAEARVAAMARMFSALEAMLSSFEAWKTAHDNTKR